MKTVFGFQNLMIYTIFTVFNVSFAGRVITFDSVTCTVSNKSVKAFECFAKPVTKDRSSLNVILHFVKPVPKALLKYDVALKTPRRGFRSIMNGKDIDLCKFLDGSDVNIAINYGINLVKKYLPKGVLHPCPYSGTLALTDVLSGSAESKMTTFPEATYKIILKFYNNEDDKIVEVTMICTSKNVQIIK